MNSYSSSFSVGKGIEIYYDINNPAKIGNKTTDTAMVIIPAVGAVLFSVGLAINIYVIRKKKKNKFLKENAEFVYAQFVSVEKNTNIEINGRNPYKVICKWYDPKYGQEHVF